MPMESNQILSPNFASPPPLVNVTSLIPYKLAIYNCRVDGAQTNIVIFLKFYSKKKVWSFVFHFLVLHKDTHFLKD